MPLTLTLRATLGALLCLALNLPMAPHAGAAGKSSVRERTIRLTTEDGRDLAVSVYAPARGCRACTLVIFSHGNLATPGRYDVLLRDWAARGLVVAAPLHTDSEEYPEPGKFPDSRATRLADWRAVDRAFTADAVKQLPLEGITLSGQVVAAGHSYGALIALIAGGAELADPAWTIAPIRKPLAVISLSPPGAMKGLATRDGLAKLSTPALVVTGTTDVLPGFIDTWQKHLEAYEAAAPGLAYGLVFTGMDHYFNGAYCRPTEDGMRASEPQVARLNREIGGFIRAALAAKLPGPAAWTARSDAMVTAKAH